MVLPVNLRLAARKPQHLEGNLSPAELDLVEVDELVHLRHPVAYALDLVHQGTSLLVQGRVEGCLDCECARCLKPFQVPLRLENWACLIPLEGEDKALVINDCVDLTPYLREDILLAFPRHPLCDPECQGLPEPGGQGAKTTGASQNEGVSSAWAELNKLKLSG